MKSKTTTIARIIFIFLFFIIFGLAIVTWWAVGENLPKTAVLEINEDQNATEIMPKDIITIASYNIAHGQGLKVHSSDYRDKETTLEHLEKLNSVINKLDADILLLQEVDLDSDRTHNINQLEYLTKNNKYKYSACAIVWKKNYIPFPYWPIEHHIGYVRAANCVLSKYELSNHYRIIFDKPKANTWWYNLGYLDRAIQRVDVKIGIKKIALLNVHLEAWDANAREDQIKILSNYMNEVELPIVLGGDFNTILPTEPIKTGFIDEPEADFTNEKTLAWFFANQPSLIMPNLKHAYTFPSDTPTRGLDHIFLRGDIFKLINFRVVTEAKTASDHLPVEVTVKLKN